MVDEQARHDRTPQGPFPTSHRKEVSLVISALELLTFAPPRLLLVASVQVTAPPLRGCVLALPALLAGKGPYWESQRCER
jgi:hypothetical protein